ncbi:hypothetical protein ACHQM5_027243 [Ranunculus cassubicifolius]
MAKISISSAAVIMFVVSIFSAVAVSAQDFAMAPAPEAMPPSMVSGSASASLSAVLVCSSVVLCLMTLLKH